MPDQIATKRLKKKMLDRWENEGGMINADPTSPEEGTPTSGHEGQGKQLSASQDNSTAGSPVSPKMQRKPTRK
jgi:hypothetical protein